MKIAVIGDGGWGTTLAIILCNKGYDVNIWSAFENYARYISENMENPKYLPGIRLPSNLEITHSVEDTVKDIQIIVFAVPSNYIRSVAGLFSNKGLENKIVLSAAKGIEENTLKTMSEVLREVLLLKNIAVISGPNIAIEIAKGLPASTVIACIDNNIARRLQEIFIGKNFRAYTTDDVIGVEMGGALKNIIAIAAGVSDGLGFGANTKAALMVRGMVEITRLGIALGGRRETFFGLSGMGDLITTCLSANSRNRTFGESICSGENPLEIFSKSIFVIEGVRTTKAALGLALRYSIEMPITKEVNDIIFNKKDPRCAVEDLMTRAAKPE
ncbi:glycerol-3-phosphate dehydrogenase [bacterium Unc6]|nr:glycerol-3-phosphate dehydrogenase [bacterium Unc6]